MDLYHQFGSDLIVGANGDLLPATADTEIQQRLLRRLFTPEGAYLWQLDFGAGVPQRVGDTLSPSVSGQILAQIKAAIALEPGIAQIPVPVITLSTVDGGLVGSIQYVDAQTKLPAVITFPEPT
ncbi:MAG TPA: phage tail protein [Gammaproteobacteria bacterium]|jgi:phage baseplate assembly protein W